MRNTDSPEIETLHFDVTITENDLNIYDSRQGQHPSFSEFLNAYQNEIAFAKDVLKDAPVGAQLHAHYKGKQLRYTNQDTREDTYLDHTYLKITDKIICVKLVRKCILAQGAFGRVKLLFNIANGNRIVAKELFFKNQKDTTHHLDETARAHTLTRQFSGAITETIIHRQRNPFKRQKPEEPVQFGNVFLYFYPKKNSVQKEAEEKSTKPFLFYEYRGEDLITFTEDKKRFRSTDVDQLPTLLQKLLFQLNAMHHQGFLHLDIKAENILILRDETTDELKPFFCDFDFSERMEPGTHVCHTTLKGTPPYLAPELLLYLGINNPIFKTLPELFATRKVLADYLNLGEGKLSPEIDEPSNFAIYSTKTDGYALSKTIQMFLNSPRISDLMNSASEQQQHKIKRITQLFRLMRHSQPKARPSLTLMQLAILRYQHGSERNLPQLLKALKLPPITFDNLTLLSKCLTLIANYFPIDNPHPHELIDWLYTYINEQFVTENNQPVQVASLVEFICLLYHHATNKNSTLNSPQFIRDRFFTANNTFAFIRKHLDSLHFDLSNLIFSNTYCFAVFCDIMQFYDSAKSQVGHKNPTTLSRLCIDKIIEITQKITSQRSGATMLKAAFDDIQLYDNIFKALISGKTIWDIIADATNKKNIAKLKFLENPEMRPLYGIIPEINACNMIRLGATINDHKTLEHLTEHALFLHRPSSPTLFASSHCNNASHLRFHHNFTIVVTVNRILQIARRSEHTCSNLHENTTRLQAFLECITNNIEDSMGSTISIPTDFDHPAIHKATSHLARVCENKLFHPHECAAVIHHFHAELHPQENTTGSRYQFH